DSQPPTPPTPSEGEISIGTAVSHAVRVIGVLAQKEPQKLTSHVVTLFEGLMDPDRQSETVDQV
ncbi:MAG TPA: hypothetical protein VES68_00800, partial [Candidatus Sulfotelmatobacter sp.]|nr:hypothetical protein [Candidatus Sulfotelmatobacter sp.]